MVSTRQMSTSSSGVNGGSASNNPSNIAEELVTRVSVVTRQTSAHIVSVNYPTEGMSTTQRNLTQTSTSGAAAATVVATITSASSRQLAHLAHSLKAGTGNNAASEPDSITIHCEPSTSSESIQSAPPPSTHFFDLPTEIITKIFSYIGFKKVAQLRIVSHQTNDICMQYLNSTFSKLIKLTFNRFHGIKSNMPRRESARRNHPMACECDIIETCYMRLSLLQMTFGKHIERGHCCFFPGAILDEVISILAYIKNTPRLERPYRVTDELFDLSTMAMEYFRDRIEPTLPDIGYFNKAFFTLPKTTNRPPLAIVSDLSESSSSLPSPPQSNMVLRKGIRKIKQGMKIYNNQLSVLRSELRSCKRKSSELSKQITEQQKLLAEQQKQTLEYANRLNENDKKNEEMSRKFSTLLQELNKCKTELQYWRSKSPAIPACTSCGQKVSPMLPPEDYQALVNQGVKPEDILNLNDDTDAESDASMSENIISLREPFVFPDEATTAKLVAVNAATKNLKRQHPATTNGKTSTIISSGASGSRNELGCSLINDSHCEKVNKIADCEMNSCHPTQGSIDLTSVVASAAAMDAANSTIEQQLSSGYSTKLFYGTSVHKGVIVSPSMLAKTAFNAAVNSDAAPVGNEDGVTGGEEHLMETGCNDSNNGMEDVSNLQAITSQETKKARRVQKTTRCLSSNGKRGK